MKIPKQEYTTEFKELAVKRIKEGLTPRAVSNLSLRGAIAVALALSLPPGPERNTVLAITYVLVVFSILFQGLTVGSLAKRLLGNEHAASPGCGGKIGLPPANLH